MELLIWAGTAVTILGLCGLIWCILTVLRARNAGLDDAVLKSRLQKIVAYNMGAFFLSAIGLMMIVVGIFLG